MCLAWHWARKRSVARDARDAGLGQTAGARAFEHRAAGAELHDHVERGVVFIGGVEGDGVERGAELCHRVDLRPQFQQRPRRRRPPARRLGHRLDRGDPSGPVRRRRGTDDPKRPRPQHLPQLPVSPKVSGVPKHGRHLLGRELGPGGQAQDGRVGGGRSVVDRGGAAPAGAAAGEQRGAQRGGGSDGRERAAGEGKGRGGRRPRRGLARPARVPPPPPSPSISPPAAGPRARGRPERRAAARRRLPHRGGLDGPRSAATRWIKGSGGGRRSARVCARATGRPRTPPADARPRPPPTRLLPPSHHGRRRIHDSTLPLCRPRRQHGRRRRPRARPPLALLRRALLHPEAEHARGAVR